MKVLQVISRILVGALFVVSGIVKANDTVGFSFKLEEYFEVFGGAWSWFPGEFFHSIALPLAMVIVVAEIMLGVATLFGSKMKLITWSLLIMIVGFTFLTFYSAYFNKVTDCGCFGDAIKLTPWQSFTKDAILLVPIIFLFIRRDKLLRNTYMDDLSIFPFSIILISIFSLEQLDWPFPMIFVLVLFPILLFFKYYIKSDRKDLVLAILTFAGSGWFVMHTYHHLPMKDFRAYAVGKNIPEQMMVPEGAPVDVYERKELYTHKVTGQEKWCVMSKDCPWQDSAWVWSDFTQKLLIKGFEAPIHDLSFEDADGNDYTEDIMAEPFIFLVAFYDVENGDETSIPAIKELLNKANSSGVYSYGMTISSIDQIEQFKSKHELDLDFLQVDQTALKTMIRSRPGIILLNKGTVYGKWHYLDVPNFDDLATDIKKKIDQYNTAY